MNESCHEIHVIGLTASGLNSLSFQLKDLVLSAKRIGAPIRILDSLPSWWGKNNLDNPLPELIASDQISRIIDVLKSKDKKTVLLASGDPLWFGIGRLLLEEIPRERLFFHPSPTSMQLAFARLGRSWQDASWVSLHGRDPLPLAKCLQQRPNALIVLIDPLKGGAEDVQKFVRSSGLQKNYSFWIFEQLGHSDERVIKILPDEEIPKDLNPLHLVALIKEDLLYLRQENLPLFGIEDGVFKHFADRPGLMTKREVRVQILADLDLPKEGVMWDICAGGGSIGLEALRIRPELKLLSIDKRAGAKELIQINAERLKVNPTAILESEALEMLTKGNLPSSLNNPDRVLLGGGGPLRTELLKRILKQLNPGGIIVIPLSTLQALPEIEDLLKSNNFQYSLSHHQSYRGVPLGDGTRLSPMNPVFIIKSQKC